MRRLSMPAVYLMMLVTSLMIAGTFVVGAAITDGLAPSVLTLLRFLLASFLLAPWLLLRFGWRAVLFCSPSLFFRCAAISLCLVGFFIGMFYSLRFTTAINTSVIYTLVPAISSLISFLLTKEKILLRRFIALSLGLAGAVWVILQGKLSLLFTMHWGYGDIVFACACVVMGFYTPLLKYFYRGENMEIVTYWILVTGTIWLLGYAGGELFHTDLRVISTKLWAGIIYLVVFATILSFYFTQIAIPYIGPTRVIAWSYLYPVLVLLIEFSLGKGMPEVAILPGVAVISISMILLMTEKN